MTAWWNTLSARERLMLRALGVVAGVCLAWLLVVSPLAAFSSDAKRREQVAETGHKLVAEAAARLGASARPASDAATPVRAALTDMAAAHTITFTFINPRPDGSVEAQIGSAPPERLYAMIAALETRYGVRVVSADIARVADGAADLRAQITFTR